jgi:hypothetical protein
MNMSTNNVYTSPQICELSLYQTQINSLYDGSQDRKCVVNVKIKGKIFPVLPLIEHHAMKAYWGNGGTARPIL